MAVKLESIIKEKNYLDQDCVRAMFTIPHPASKYDPTDMRRAYVDVELLKDDVEETMVTISFNRYKVTWLDMIEVLAQAQLSLNAVRERFAGFLTPLVPTKYEMDLIWDKKHDEVFDENES